jgi:hypothetical protein
MSRFMKTTPMCRERRCGSRATRYDNKIEHYRAFLYAACMLITLRQF